MQYESDEDKNRLNQRKHGISFEVAVLAFEDERCLVRLDRNRRSGGTALARDWIGSY
jgi:uncharacterized DUF497 family protein